MRPLPSLILVGSILLLAVAGCGKGSKATRAAAEPRLTGPAAIACGKEIGRQEVADLLQQAKRAYGVQKRAFPKAGTRAYRSLQDGALGFLVKRAELASRADRLGIAISDSQIDAEINRIVKQSFGGDRAKLEKRLTLVGMSPEQLRSDTRASLVSRALYARVTRRVRVTEPAVKAFYISHLSQYKLPATRQIRQILVRDKATAERIHARLEKGASFAALARESSIDQTAPYGGLMTVRQGQTVPPLGAAFALKTNELSHPLHASDGWHLILPVTKIEPSSYQAISDVERPIRQTLLATRQEGAIKRWTNRLTASCAKTLRYTRGYAPARAQPTK